MTQLKEYRSVKIARICMKLVGFWHVETAREKLFLRIVFTYAVWAISFAILVLGIDLYHCILSGDFYAITYNLCTTLVLIMIMVKLGSFMIYKDIVMKLIRFAETNFWNVTYDEAASNIMKEYDEFGITMTYTFTVIVYFAIVQYCSAPIFENYGNNGTKELPFKLWMDFPYRSPYYEVIYFIQALSTVHSGISTFCFDNFVSTFNLHVAAQLKILAYRVEVLANKCVENTAGEKQLSDEDTIASALKILKKCVKQHVILIRYVDDMHQLLTILLLGQVLLSSAIICFGGFQVLAADGFSRKGLFACHFIGGVAQLFLYTWTCNDIIVQSTAISDAAFNAEWYLLPNTDSGLALKKGLIMIMMRGRQPCALTAGHFVVMSLDTFMAILSTAMSYFTLLRQMSEDL